MNKLFKNLIKETLENKNIKNGSIISGNIINIEKNFVTIDSGLKSESYIDINQFKNSEGKINIKINDIIDLYLENIENGKGETILSREKAKKYKSWLNLEKSYKKSKIINGIINNKVKGGFTVDINGIKAFLPGSLVDIKPIKDTSFLEGKELEFKVIKLDKKNNNIVISRKAAIFTENNNEREKLIESLKEGLIINGIIKNITDYGVFIDLGGLDGLLHITDIAWKRVKHPSEILNIGDEIKVKIIKYDKIKTRVSLGLKQLTEDPWKDINKKYPTNTKILGTVTNLTDYGCFLEIEEGIEGLVHISELNWTKKNINPYKIISIGEKIEALILNIDQIKRRISLSIKRCQENPWKIFSKKYKKGDLIKGKIKSITEFGIFVGLENNIDGLIHKSDLSWDQSKNEKIINNYNKKDNISSLILQIDCNKERISLGIKQLTEDPLNKYLNILTKEKIIKVKIIKIDNKIIKTLTNDKIDGIIQKNENFNKKNNIYKNLKINEFINIKISNIDKNKRIINMLYINKENKIKKLDLKSNNCFNAMAEAFKKAQKK